MSTRVPCVVITGFTKARQRPTDVFASLGSYKRHDDFAFAWDVIVQRASAADATQTRYTVLGWEDLIWVSTAVGEVMVAQTAQHLQVCVSGALSGAAGGAKPVQQHW